MYIEGKGSQSKADVQMKRGRFDAGEHFFSGIRISLACNRIESFFCLLTCSASNCDARRRCEMCVRGLRGNGEV